MPLAPFLPLPDYGSCLLPERGVDRVRRGAVLALNVEAAHRSGNVQFRDRSRLRKTNLWRDLYPGDFEGQLREQSVGAWLEQAFEPVFLTGYHGG